MTLCDRIDSRPPGSPVPGILQGRTLEWVAISFSSAWKWKVKVKSLSRPHELQPSRLLRPWDLPGKSAGVGCHCLLHCKSQLVTYFTYPRLLSKSSIMQPLSTFLTLQLFTPLLPIKVIPWSSHISNVFLYSYCVFWFRMLSSTKLF